MMYKTHYVLVKEYTTGFLERGCGREADKARGVAECLIRLRDHIRRIKGTDSTINAILATAVLYELRWKIWNGGE